MRNKKKINIIIFFQPIKHHDPLPRRKISAPAYRPGRTQMAMPANRRASVAVAPRRINRRGSEVSMELT